MGHLAFVLNAGSGAGKAEAVRERIIARAREAGREARIHLVRSGADLGRIVADALEAGADAVIAGGGDGTVSAVANGLAGRDTPMGILPLGTLNHFAKDAGVPLDLEPALDAVFGGRTGAFDAGEVNGHIFLNNASLGLYPLIVRLRQQHVTRGPAKWVVAVWATLREVRANRQIRVRLLTEGQSVERRTPILFLGNNEYTAEGFELGTRESLRDGLLAIYVVNAPGRLRVLRLVWRMLRRTAWMEDLELIRTADATIGLERPRVTVALDGELVPLEAPLAFRSRPAALRILLPNPEPEGPTAAGAAGPGPPA